MFILDYNHSIASHVGFIAMIGLAVETDVIMLTYLNMSTHELTAQKTNPTIRKLIVSNASLRLRHVLMTALTDMIALTPLFWGDEPGNQAMRRIAAPMVGGSFTCIIVTLFLLPILYEWWMNKQKA